MKTTKRHHLKGVSFANRNALRDFLLEHRIDCSRWAPSLQTLTVDDLYMEIKSGRSIIFMAEDMPVRLLQIAIVHVYQYNHEKELMELQKVLRKLPLGGIKRYQRMMSLNTKIKQGETAEDAVRRVIRNDLRIRDPEFVDISKSVSANELCEFREDDKFPGLQTVCLHRVYGCLTKSLPMQTFNIGHMDGSVTELEWVETDKRFLPVEITELIKKQPTYEGCENVEPE